MTAFNCSHLSSEWDLHHQSPGSQAFWLRLNHTPAFLGLLCVDSVFRLCLSCRERPVPRSCLFLACPYQSTDWCNSMRVINLSQTPGLTWRVIPPLELPGCLTSLYAHRCCKQGHSLINILHIKLKLGIGISLLHGRPIDKISCFVLCSSSKEHNYNQRQKIHGDSILGLIIFFQKWNSLPEKTLNAVRQREHYCSWKSLYQQKTLVF